MKNLNNICRIVVGSVFIFSGLVKGIDPYGSMYKFIDYFTAFNLDSLNGIALILGILLSLFEFLVGFSLISGIRLKAGILGSLILMAIFTPLTLVLAISNPVTDCGCFGDAIKLSNWQTFFKNIALLVLVIPLLISGTRFINASGKIREWIILTISSLLFILFTIYNYRHLPLVDFRPYTIGTDIEQGMTIPDDAPVDEYDIKLLYEKDGVIKEFDMNNYPSEDTSWVFIDQKSVLIRRGYEPPIHDFILSTPEGDDLTDYVINNPEFTFIMIARHIEDTKPESLYRGIEAGKECIENGINFYLLTSSSEEDVKSLGNDFSYLFGDDTMLKTIIRSNPGFVLLKDGVIRNKWSARDLPDTSQLYNYIVEKSNKTGYNPGLRILLIFGIALLASMISRVTLRKNSIN